MLGQLVPPGATATSIHMVTSTLSEQEPAPSPEQPVTHNTDAGVAGWSSSCCCLPRGHCNVSRGASPSLDEPREISEQF